jgi:multiple sugar transport system ATP-binding protein
MAAVSLRSLRKSYGSTVVVKEISLEIEDSEFLVLLGPSGCGKSTVLRMIAGLEPITDGEICIAGKVVNRLDPRERDIAMVFQNYALYPHMKVRDNIGFCLENMGVSKSVTKQRVEDAARTVRMEDYLDRLPGQLSGGQRQRVAIGRAIVRKPKVFLMDEPLSNLDAKLRSEMRAELSRLHDLLRITTIYVTHDQVEAMTLADRIVVMNGGVVQQVGAPMEVYRRPHNRFVAGFIGTPTMNFLELDVVDDGDGRRLRAEGVDVKLPEPMAARLDAFVGLPITLGFRPQHVRAAAPGEALFEGPVEVVEPYGPETYATLRVGAASVSARLEPTDTPVKGKPFHLSADIGDLYFFDPETSSAIY